MRVSAKTDYAVRATIEMARATEERPATAEQIAGAQQIPLRFLDPVLTELRYAGLVERRVGPEGGYWLARPPDEITLTEVISEVDGPLVGVRGEPPDELILHGDAQALQEVWIALRASMREILDSVTIADLASGQLPEPVRRILRESTGGTVRRLT